MMNRKFLPVLVLSAAVGVAGHALFGSLASPRTAEARVRAFDSGDVRWEYCAVVKAQYPGNPRLVYWIAYFKGDSVKTEDVQTGVSGNAFAKAVAKLGDEGWEMVGEGPLETVMLQRPGGAPNAIFFKRRKD
jgi:hypothetical protein